MPHRRRFWLGLLSAALLWALAFVVAHGEATPPAPQPNDRRVVVQGRYAYLADAHGYPYTIIRIVDIADPVHPVQVGAYTSGVGEYVDLAVQDRYAYLAHGGYSQIDTIEVTDPKTPVFVGTGPAYVGGAYLTVAGAYGYVTYTRDVIVLHTLDLSDPAHPVELASARAGIGPEAAARPVLVGGHAYVPVASGIVVFDVRDAAHPALVGRYVVAGSPYNATPALAVAPPGGNTSRRYGYYTNQATLHVVDLTDPTNPVEVGSSAAPGGSWWAAQVAGAALYGASAGGLQVLSLADPTQPMLVGSYAGAAYDIAVIGNTSYLAAGADGLKVVDIANPGQPRLLGAFLLPKLRLPFVPQKAN